MHLNPQHPNILADMQAAAIAEGKCMKATYEQLEQSLSLATNLIMAGEPGDSRAVSDIAVALCAVQCGLVDSKVMNVINTALKAET